MRRLYGPGGAAALAAGLIAFFAAGGFGQGSGAAASAAASAQQIGLRVLVITDGTNPADPTPVIANAGIAYSDWANTLRREGVPFDTVDTSTGSVPLPPLSSTQPNGTEVANYEGVVVTTSGKVGLNDAQWTALQTFEQHFSVRQVTAYAVPSSDYGMNPPPPVTAGGGPLNNTPLTLTADGRAVFPYLNSIHTDPCPSANCTWGYEGTPMSGAKVTTLISGPNSSTLLGVYTSPDGRQTMFQTFNENQYMLQSELLRHGELAWLTRNTFFGDQRNYLETNIDDNFLSDAAWSITGNASTPPHSTDFNEADSLREVPADVIQAAQWSKANSFRIDMLYNGGGSVGVATGETLVGAGDAGSGGTGSTGGANGSGCSTVSPCPDPLLAQFTASDTSTGKPYTSDFGWISHTWDHPNVDEGCATQNYIEAEINQNSAWGARAAAGSGDPITGGLGLSSSTDPTAALGAVDPQVIIPGEHSGLANLIPGNPGQVDPPSLDEATAALTGGTLATGSYVYAITDQFNTALPGLPPTVGTGQSAASISAPVAVTGPTGSVALAWGAVCHAGRYSIYRAPVVAGVIGAWSLITTVNANTNTDFLNPTGNSTTNTAGGGAAVKTYTDTGTAGTSTGSSGTLTTTSTPSTAGAAIESAYEQNPVLDAAFVATSGGGIKYFGADASKPYPTPADASFPTGSPPASQYPKGQTFPAAGGTAIPRWPTNVYYNVSTNAQEVDEYQTLYNYPTCVPVPNITTCNNPPIAYTIQDIVASADQGMFQHMMGNDPRPHYFHQTNLMSQHTGTVNGMGDGLFYETMDPLLTQYRQYFNSSAPIIQLTMPQIGNLLTWQAGWANAAGSQVTGSISGNVVTVANSGGAIEMPLTGTTVGTPYAGSQSGWVLAPSGISTYTALAAWPAPPIVKVTVQVPNGPAPGKPGTNPANNSAQGNVCVQTGSTTSSVSRRGFVTAHLKCTAASGTGFVTGKVALKVKGQTAVKSFRIRSGKAAGVTIKLPRRARKAAAAKRHPVLHAKLTISTTQPHGKPKVTVGSLTIGRPKPHLKKHAKAGHRRA
jgi:hypothetical protein